MEVLHDMLDQVERQRLNKMMDEMPDNVTIQQRCVSLSYSHRTRLTVCSLADRYLDLDLDPPTPARVSWRRDFSTDSDH